jgi:hypothetical protein
MDPCPISLIKIDAAVASCQQLGFCPQPALATGGWAEISGHIERLAQLTIRRHPEEIRGRSAFLPVLLAGTP